MSVRSPAGVRLDDLARHVKADVLAGRRPGDSPAAVDLCAACEGLMKSWVRKRLVYLGVRGLHDWEDLLQTLRLETLSCVAGYDGEHSFATYLIGGRVQRRGRWFAAARRWWQSCPVVRPPQGCGSVTEPLDSIDEPVVRMESEPVGDDPSSALHRALAVLTVYDPRGAAVVRYRYLGLDPVYRREVARRLRLTPKQVQFAEGRALRRLRLAIQRDPSFSAIATYRIF